MSKAKAEGFNYYPYIRLNTIRQFEPDMRRLGVSKVARSPRGFLTYYKKIGGIPSKVNDYWSIRRAAFIARHMAQYEDNPTYRRRLALIAWAYDPK